MGVWTGKLQTPPPSPPLEGRGDSAQPSKETQHSFTQISNETQLASPRPSRGGGWGVGSQTSSPFVPCIRGISEEAM